MCDLGPVVSKVSAGLVNRSRMELLLLRARAFRKGYRRNTSHSCLRENNVLKPPPQRVDTLVHYKDSVVVNLLNASVRGGAFRECIMIEWIV